MSRDKRGGWNNYEKEGLLGVCGLGRRDTAWNLRATGLPVICMLSTLRPVQGLSWSCLHSAHSYSLCLYSRPHSRRLYAHSRGSPLSGPVALQQHLGAPLPGHRPDDTQRMIEPPHPKTVTKYRNLKQRSRAPLSAGRSPL